ncbi:MAG TPA: sulfite exporter TauE/SafE family protein [Ferruginibacter sp.]|nr:sulfite exporter TauE/SafE family protein [Ferruginibacter sp.]HRO06050.1 sulfite exporter TauE/SafE family protein [Ferruginibacter sp.]HRO95696.1 sulfite exporter TauE/SafE family protein [Ferruginibacter sp.]HRP49295.1 sulfite exporter TauE/SafE family protein [Ferruginibacter sp.]
MEIAGYIASLVIGLSLGLIGGGGSILTVPVLVYLFGVDPVAATAYSLFIVGTTSLVGVWPKYLQKEVNFKTALIFGLPSIVAVYATRAFIIPVIPDQLFTAGNFVLTKPLLLMLIFAVLMVAASFSMIRTPRKRPVADESVKQKFNYPVILLEGTLVGVLTGLVGAGGGFLIIPALVILSKLPMKQAVGTSLLIIAAKSLIGFTGDVGKIEMDWPLLLSVTALAVVGIFIGNRLSKRIAADALKKGFGWFVLVMGIYIITKELFF